MDNELKIVIADNLEFYQKVKVKDGLKFCQHFQALLVILNKIAPVISEIESFAGDYDLDEQTVGNGYRSVVYLYETAVESTLEACKLIQEQRLSMFFRKSFYEREVAAYQELLQNLFVITCNLVESHLKADAACLFSEVGTYENKIHKVKNSIKMESFFGRTANFQLKKSIHFPLKQLIMTILLYSEYYYSNEHKLLKFIRLPLAYIKYFFDSELWAHRLVKVYKNAEISFYRSMMQLGESWAYKLLQNIFEAYVSVNQLFQIPPEPLKIYSEKRKQFVEIPVPSSHIGVRPICCRLLSAKRRKGMIQVEVEAVASSKYLIFEVHGGGWTTQTSASNLCFLKLWANKLDVPILSIDYSLAPEAAFPRAIEEIFYAYCWALKNPELVGSTGENIVFVGDSAGANLITACLMKCIEMGIRKPKGLFCIYGVFMNDYAMVPSRYCALMDVFLSYDVYMQLFKSYEGEKSKETNITQNRQIPEREPKRFNAVSKHYLISPYRASDELLSEFPKMNFLSTNVDPCLDDSVEFAKKLRKLGVEVHLDVLEGLCHGFMGMSAMSRDCYQGALFSMKRVAQLLNLPIE